MFKKYVLATRPWSFPVSTMSVLVTSAGLFYLGYAVNWWYVLWATIGILLFHAAGNVLSDYRDYAQGVDRSDTFGSKTLTDKILTPRQALILGWVLMAIALVNGIAMWLCSGWQLLIFGLAGALLSVCYSWLKYHALGEVDIFLEYGVLPALGTSFFVTGAVTWEALWFMPAFVTITIGVLFANNTRDIVPDKRANIYTLPMLLSQRACIILYDIDVLLPFAWVILCCLLGKMPWLSLLVFVVLKKAIDNCRTMHRLPSDNQAINALDEGTAQQQLLNCLILVLTMVIMRLV